MKKIFYAAAVMFMLCAIGFFVLGESDNENGGKPGFGVNGNVNETANYVPLHWIKFRKMNGIREMLERIRIEGPLRNFIKTHENASLTASYDKTENRWRFTLLPKNNDIRMEFVVDNETGKIIYEKISECNKPVILKWELFALLSNRTEFKEFISDCGKSKRCGKPKIREWYDKERCLWVVSIYGDCKECRKIILVDGRNGTVIENKKVFDKEKLLSIIKSNERIRNFIKNHPDAKFNAVYDELSDQWHVTVSYAGKPGIINEITAISSGITGEVISVSEWEYSRSKFK